MSLSVLKVSMYQRSCASRMPPWTLGGPSGTLSCVFSLFPCSLVVPCWPLLSLVPLLSLMDSGLPARGGKVLYRRISSNGSVQAIVTTSSKDDCCVTLKHLMFWFDTRVLLSSPADPHIPGWVSPAPALGANTGAPHI